MTGLSEMMEEHLTLQLCEPSVNLAARAAIFVFGKQTKAGEKQRQEDVPKVLKIIASNDFTQAP